MDIVRTVTKELKWEAAHRLAKGYEGKCAHIHGHSWLAFVTIELKPGEALDQYDFVEDYAYFKKVRQWVDEKWDHAMLVFKSDEKMLNFLIENRQRYYYFNANPTSEVIAETLFKVASWFLNKGRSRVMSVRINETCTSEALYEERKYHPAQIKSIDEVAGKSAQAS